MDMTLDLTTLEKIRAYTQISLDSAKRMFDEHHSFVSQGAMIEAEGMLTYLDTEIIKAKNHD